MDSVKAFVVECVKNPGKALRSALTTVVAVAAVLAAVGQVASVPADVVALVATATAVLRTLIAAVDAGNAAYGRGSA